jgi:hypothetical protein
MAVGPGFRTGVRGGGGVIAGGGGYRGGGYGYRGGGYGYHRHRHYRPGFGFWPGVAIGVGLGSSYGYYDDPYYYGDPYGYGTTVVAAAPGGDDAVAYCMRRFKSYDPQSGTYLGYDGQRHPCP